MFLTQSPRTLALRAGPPVMLSFAWALMPLWAGCHRARGCIVSQTVVNPGCARVVSRETIAPSGSVFIALSHTRENIPRASRTRVIRARRIIRMACAFGSKGAPGRGRLCRSGSTR